VGISLVRFIRLQKNVFFYNSLGLLTLPSSVIFDKVELVQYFIFKIAAKTAPQSTKNGSGFLRPAIQPIIAIAKPESILNIVAQ